MGDIIAGFCATHTPRIADEVNAPQFTRELIAAMHELGDLIDELRPDTIVMISTHWFTTFVHYVACHPRHQGYVTALECPDMINSLPYDFPGDPELGRLMVKKGNERGVPVYVADQKNFVFDYGSVVPVRYLTPRNDVPFVIVSLTAVCPLEEYYTWGEAVAEAIRELRRHVLVVTSGSFSHTLVRGPERWPLEEHQKLDRELVGLLCEGRLDEARAMLPWFVETTRAEGWGKHIAFLLSLLGASGHAFKGELHAYGPSSGSGNPVVSLLPVG